MMRHLVCGCGEVGAALRAILECDGEDHALKIMPRSVRYDVLHICIPYSDHFEAIVRGKQHLFSPAFTVIHSTVPIGTSEKLDALHSPVRGKHPQLEESIRTFVKYVGGPESEVMARELQNYGIPAWPIPCSRDTEAGKLLDLMQYGAMILLEKEIHEFCEKHGIDFDIAYRQFNEGYNLGFIGMGESHLTRPVLKHHSGPIGGHCVAQNMIHIDSPSAKKITEFNTEAHANARNRDHRKK